MLTLTTKDTQYFVTLVGDVSLEDENTTTTDIDGNELGIMTKHSDVTDASSCLLYTSRCV